jgi:predicted nuclease of predicted toxin-antitoxin system
VKFLIDAQLPRLLSNWLNSTGHDSIHTLDLPDGNRTSDIDISEIAEREMRIVVTKDSDFVDSFLLNHSPRKLLLISTGNINNRELERAFHGANQLIAEPIWHSRFHRTSIVRDRDPSLKLGPARGGSR